ncbi:amino acid adenylation domain-containing protein [Streptomyces sp. NBC_01763]|uniref:amino acid adenylation domain-containing protein n=1 Tax=Streptomyces sp. NBC_01763 TaxID=2975934 RepID=UPI002DD9A1FA|nr:amino acid adenylation domain-containing protein [Streptomyces sp. NBC_01763]WSC38963.1 amino acid adenylation domain-containing protein [Streptomyces sp. NBC_01763]
MPTARHTLTVRLPLGATDDGPVATALATASKRWWPDGPHPRLWTETVPAPADSARAARRRETETRRPLGPGQLLRVLLLRYEEEGAGESGGGSAGGSAPVPATGATDNLAGTRAGGTAGDLAGAPAVGTAQGTVRPPVARPADLVLVADPAALDATSLRLISRVLCGELGPQEVRTAEHSPAAHPARVPGPEALLRAAATALVLGRYEGRSSVRVAVPVSALDRPGNTLGAFDGRAVLEADLSEGRTVGDLLATPLSPPGDDAVDEAAPAERHVARVQDQLATVPPGTPLIDLVLLDETESAEQLALGRPPRSAVPPPRPSRRIDEAFADQVALRPEAPALTCGERTLTYRELDSRADELAAGLRARGVRPGDHVGLCLPRSTDLVAMMLAVLKADAIYVPLDPDHPADRRARTAEDAGLRLTVEDTAPLTGHPADHRAPTARPATAPAYVIHTSGSTGRPKGVVVPHSNVLALIDATRDDFGLTPGDTWTLFHSSAFDFSVWEIWGALLTGARLVVVDYWVSRSPADFHALLVREGVTVLSQTPSAFTQLMAADREHGEHWGRGTPLALRLVVLGGEPLDARPLRDWFDRHPEDRCRLVNMFGITETTVHVTAQTVTRRTALSGSRSVGHPLPGWYVYVLDARGRPVPPGAPGEIHVGGAGVATGYLGRPGLTGQRFVPDPWHGGRMYRSGDLGRLLPDGTLEHLGRIDSQVKVRGFRIELDEIRHVLLADLSVTAAAVTVSGDAFLDAAGVRIDAYVVLAADPVGTADDIRRRAAKLLPEHMLPASVTALPRLPLTPNGKLDPSRLPAPTAPADAPPGIAAPAAADPFAELTGIWESVLGVPVGPDDNFFDLGGNSLYAIRLATAMRERGLPPVALRRLYLSPTVRSLSEAVDE